MNHINLLILLLCAGAAFGQTQTATVRGVVTDRSGAVVPGAAVTLRNVDQNRDYQATTNGEGEYVLVQIPPSHYSLSVEAKGFKKYQRTGMVLEVAQVAALDVQLEVGATTEVVEVTTQVPLLDTASSTLDAVFNSKTGEALPLNGRNILQLVALTPGINTSRSARGATTGSGSISSMAFSANGGRDVSNEVMLDGSPQMVMGYNQPAYVPSPDALQEFRVQTNSLSAEYGRTGGAVVNLVHRSGTTEFHGVLYEFLRNDKFDANTFFSNRSGAKKPAFRFNQFGFTFGGPLTPSRQTTFFFLNYEAVRNVNPGNSTMTVPTPAMKSGDFSGVAETIYDPATINAAGVRQPFAGNRIPSARFNPVALKMLGYYPAPTRTGLSNNFYAQSPSPGRSDNFSAKIDRRVSNRQNLYGRFSWNDVDNRTANYFNNLASPDTGASGARNRSITVDDTFLVGGWVLHGNAGYAYHANPRDSVSRGFDLTTLGLPASLKAVSQFEMFPRVEPGGYAALGGNATWIIGNKFETHTWTGDATKLFGGHTIKTGGVYRLNRVSNFRPNSPAGLFTFNEGFTRDTFNSNRNGNTIASMLLGVMSGGRVQYEPQLALQVTYGGVYLQDDWRVNSKLTLNLGLRWDTDRPLTERFDRTSSFDFDATLPVQAPGLAPLKGGLVFANRNGSPRGNKDPDNNNFAPRVGLAYKVTDRFVVRSGFGIFFTPTTGIGPSTGSTGAISFNATTNITTSIDGGRTPYTTLSNPFPNGYNAPTSGADGLLTQIGQAINAQARFDRVPYAAQWNFDTQYMLRNDLMFDIAYAGNAGVKLLAQTQLNQVADQYLALGDGLNASVSNPFFGIIPATSSIGQRTTTAGQLLRPYPHLTGLQQTWGSLAHSNYHSLQTKIRKRYRSGLQMQASYTWAKLIDDFSSVGGYGQTYPGFTNNNRRDLDRALSSLDIAHHLAVNFQYDLKWRPEARALRVVAAGWSVNGIMTVQSGMPIPIASQANTTGSFGGGQRPDSTGITSLTPGGPKERVDNWFNKSAFVNAARYAFGNVGRTLPDNRGPGLQVWDLSVFKTIPVREKWRVELRAEFFNAFNNVNFLPPEGTAADFGRPQFGTLTSAERARVIQFGLKFYY
ncbi:MAG: TonB-dependent receptor [Acidobacteria bacterium]|nr:TonB-dependent receptor [Acidobacteriota bacterium]